VIISKPLYVYLQRPDTGTRDSARFAWRYPSCIARPDQLMSLSRQKNNDGDQPPRLAFWRFRRQRSTPIE
jgi:hypothetical protein